MANQSNLPTVSNFKFEDYKGAPQWFAQFLSSLYLFVNPVYQILNGGVAYQNLQAPKLYSTVVTAPASGNTTFNFKNPLVIAPTAVLLGSLNVSGQPTNHPTGAAMVYWHISEGTIYVDNIVGLTASTKYAVSLVVM